MSVPPSITGIPVVGPWVGRIGQVTDLVMMDCVPNPEMWVKAAWYAAPNLLVSLTKPDWLDVVSAVKGVRHRVKRKRRFTFDYKLAATSPPPKGEGWAKFTLTGGLAQRVGWYMIVADATTDFLVNWTSAAYEYAGCTQEGFLPGTASNHSFPNYAPADDGQLAWTIDYNPSGILSVSTWFLPSGHTGSAGFTMSVAPPFFPYQTPGDPTFWVQDQFGNRLSEDFSGEDVPNQAIKRVAQMLKVYRSAAFSRTFSIRYRCDGWFSLSDFSLNVNPQRLQNMLPDP